MSGNRHIDAHIGSALASLKTLAQPLTKKPYIINRYAELMRHLIPT